MPYIMLAIGIAIGAAVGFLIASARARALKVEAKFANTRLAEKDADLQRQREDFEKTLANLKDTFRGLSSEVLKESREEFLKQSEPRLAMQIKPLEDALKRYNDAVREIENKREEAYGGLSSHIKILSSYTERLKEETLNLKSALRSPTARGKWGEMTLKRCVELAGMSRYCDFEEQANAQGEDGRLRPDMIVHLPGGKNVIVDAKSPLDAYMKATEAKDDEERGGYLAEHSKAVRDHLRKLSQKSYWEQFGSSTDMVVMFLPGESFFAAALEMDRTLFEDGLSSRVILTTPATIIALLRSFAFGWQQVELAQNSQRIADAGKELFERFLKFAKYFADIRGSLNRLINTYNDAVGSWELRVVPSLRKLNELGVSKDPEAELPAVPRMDDNQPRIVGET